MFGNKLRILVVSLLPSFPNCLKGYGEVILGFRKGPTGDIPKKNPSKKSMIWRWGASTSTWVSGDKIIIQ